MHAYISNVEYIYIYIYVHVYIYIHTSSPLNSPSKCHTADIVVRLHHA